LLDAEYALPCTTATAFHVESSSSPLSLHTWHRQLGHAGFSTILKAAAHVEGLNIDKSSLIHSTDGDSIHCVSCVMGKQKRLPFPQTARRADAVAELIHSDVWGPVDIPSSTGDSYFVVFTDDYSRYSAVYLMRSKSEVFTRFKHFLPWIQTHNTVTETRVRRDSGR